MFRTLYICMVAQRLRIINRKLRKKGKNMELKIEDNKRVFYQWDTGHRLVAENADGCAEVHFCRSGEETALVCPIREEGDKRVADVPNILLQEAGEIHAYLFRRMEDGSETVCSFSFGVNGRPKPEGYVYTETQVLDYGYLARRLEKLEGEGLGEALDAYLKENPVQAGATAEEAAQIRKNAQDIAELTTDKMDAAQLPNAIEAALAQAKASGEFDGKPGEKGDPGETPVRGADYWTDADKQEIKSYVDNAILGGTW